MLNNSTIYKSFDLEQLNLLPSNWLEQIQKVANQSAIHTHLDGKHPTSREPEDTEGADVYVATGETIQKSLPWLHELYTTKLVPLASQVAGQSIIPSSELQSGININMLRGTGARYEWHVDTNPLTGLLFATTHEPNEGGELVFKVDEKRQITVNPKAGMLLFFDARAIPHTVLPLKVDKHRISVPMNYYLASEGESRASGLDDYLFSTPSN